MAHLEFWGAAYKRRVAVAALTGNFNRENALTQVLQHEAEIDRGRRFNVAVAGKIPFYRQVKANAFVQILQPCAGSDLIATISQVTAAIHRGNPAFVNLPI